MTGAGYGRAGVGRGHNRGRRLTVWADGPDPPVLAHLR
ncbi:hypothetical protein PAI11_26490 [Patulibacter medicamentivorans]|uniref:Uncharacterized protein n=1 Tax=Patulibacter medicamentivorans TaxID=1097667 RepID=H0E747_9ACTN|nr:hypothetical protein PAI11_26490 [Patulibacter medicamentivorans]